MKLFSLFWYALCFSDALAQPLQPPQSAATLADRLVESTVLPGRTSSNVDWCSSFELSGSRNALLQMLGSPILVAELKQIPKPFNRQIIATHLKTERCEPGCFYELTITYSDEERQAKCEIIISATRKRGNHTIANFKIVSNDCNPK